MLHKAWNSKGEMPYCFPRSSIKFQGHTVQSITDFDPNWAFPDYRPVAAFKSLRFALLQYCNQSIYLYIVSSTEPLTYVLIKMIKVLDEIIHQKFASISVDVHRSSRHLYDVCIECWSQSGRWWWRWRWRRWPLRSFVRHQTLGNLFPHHKINICSLFWELLANYGLFIKSVSSIKNW